MAKGASGKIYLECPFDKCLFGSRRLDKHLGKGKHKLDQPGVACVMKHLRMEKREKEAKKVAKKARAEQGEQSSESEDQVEQEEPKKSL